MSATAVTPRSAIRKMMLADTPAVSAPSSPPPRAPSPARRSPRSAAVRATPDNPSAILQAKLRQGVTRQLAAPQALPTDSPQLAPAESTPRTLLRHMQDESTPTVTANSLLGLRRGSPSSDAATARSRRAAAAGRSSVGAGDDSFTGPLRRQQTPRALMRALGNEYTPVPSPAASPLMLGGGGSSPGLPPPPGTRPFDLRSPGDRPLQVLLELPRSAAEAARWAATRGAAASAADATIVVPRAQYDVPLPWTPAGSAPGRSVRALQKPAPAVNPSTRKRRPEDIVSKTAAAKRGAVGSTLTSSGLATTTVAPAASSSSNSGGGGGGGGVVFKAPIGPARPPGLQSGGAVSAGAEMVDAAMEAVAASVDEDAVPSITTTMQREMMERFTTLRLSADAVRVAVAVSERYFARMAEELSHYATHAHRRRIDRSDVELLFKRQGLVHAQSSMNDLIHELLPRELVEELIPVAMVDNRLR